jgi:hypothetical protein
MLMLARSVSRLLPGPPPGPLTRGGIGTIFGSGTAAVVVIVVVVVVVGSVVVVVVVGWGVVVVVVVG